jgi:hypothetical protein
VVNETGGDNDTRIEGDTDANLLFVDASTDRIGVGTSTPSQKIDLASGNLAFSSTSQKIIGKFSGDWADRTVFQNYTTDAETRVGAIPNGTSTTSSFSLSNSSSDPNNAGSASIRLNNTALSLNSNSEGTGTPLPIQFNLYDVAESSGGVSITRMTILNDGKVGIATLSPGSELDVKGTLRLSGSTSGYVGIAPAAAAGSTTYTLPSADGSNGNVLSTNGSGTLSWVAAGGTGTVTSVSGTGTVSGLTLTGTVTSSGSLTLGGTLSVNLASDVTGTLPIANGGTGSTSTTYCSLTSNVTGTLPVANGGTGITSFGTGVATWLGTPSSANLAAAVTDETGTGALVFANTPTLVSPVLGTPTSGNLSNCTVDGTNNVGYRNIPQSGSDKTTSYSLVTGDVGKFIGVGSGGSITIPDATFAAGDVVSIFNNTSGDITITCTITTAYIAGTDADKATVTLATRGVATILFLSGTVCVINGNVS